LAHGFPISRQIPIRTNTDHPRSNHLYPRRSDQGADFTTAGMVVAGSRAESGRLD